MSNDDWVHNPTPTQFWVWDEREQCGDAVNVDEWYAYKDRTFVYRQPGSKEWYITGFDAGDPEAITPRGPFDSAEVAMGIAPLIDAFKVGER